MKTCKDCDAKLPDDCEIERCEDCEVKHMEKTGRRIDNVLDVVVEFLNQL